MINQQLKDVKKDEFQMTVWRKTTQRLTRRENAMQMKMRREQNNVTEFYYYY